jgi:hypothetical protein
MNFIKNDLLVIIIFIIISSALYLIGDYILPEESRIGKKVIPLIFSMSLFAVWLFVRVQYKKWIPNKENWKDFTKNIRV